MIILDTNVLFGPSPDDPKFDLLRALKRSGQQQVGVPWMVLEELVAQRVLAYAKAYEETVSATRHLNRVAPWLNERDPKPFNRREASDYWRQEYRKLFEIVETSGEVARQALLREANCEKPAKGPEAKDKGGARDVAIWLSVVEFLLSNPQEKVYFVTANTRDFGDGTQFPAAMAEDIAGHEDRIALLVSFDSVVSTFSTPLEIDQDDVETDLTTLLTSEAAITLLASSVRELLAAGATTWEGNAVRAFLSELSPAESFPPVSWGTWLQEPKVVLRRIQNVTGHKIGEDAWYTASVDWILAGLASVPDTTSAPSAMPGFSAPARFIACQWRTKLLFSSKQEEPPVLLQSWPPESLSPAEQDEWQPLVRKALPQATALQIPDLSSNGALVAALLWAVVAAGQVMIKKRREE